MRTMWILAAAILVTGPAWGQDGSEPEDGIENENENRSAGRAGGRVPPEAARPQDGRQDGAHNENENEAENESENEAENENENENENEAVDAVTTATLLAPPDPLASTARVVASGRVSGGVLVDEGRAVVVPLKTVQVGWPADVRLGDGHLTRGRIVAVDRYEGLALLELEDAAPAGNAAIVSGTGRTVGEELTMVGHGGSVGLGEGSLTLREMLTFSPLTVRVSALESQLGEGDLAPGERPRRFLVDRGPGVGDEGAPLYDAEGLLAGLLLEAVDDAGGRALAVDATAIRDLVAEPRLEKPFVRAHHLQSWAGIGLAAHNRPSHLGATLSYGLRAVFVDQVRLEPWVEIVLGTRAGFPGSDEVAGRPRDFWWSIETGASFGWRVRMFGEGSRNYVVPALGFRAGWNRFQHRVDELVTVCADDENADGCSLVIDRSLDQERSFRAGLDLGVDIRHGPVRVGYRFFIDPANVNAHAMHRIFVTFDGGGIPLRVGDSN